MTAHAPEIWPPADIDLNDPRWVTIEQAAHLTRADESTVKRWARKRPIAVWTPGGKCWIDRTRLFLSQPPETPKMPSDVPSKAPTLPGIIKSE